MYESVGSLPESSRIEYQPSQVSTGSAWSSLRTNQERLPIRVESEEIYNASNLPPLSVAQAMTELFREAYGDKYPDARFLDPLEIRKVIQDGKYVFAALLDEHGGVLGIGGISKFDYLGADVEKYGQVREFCKLIVAQRAREFGLTERLTTMRLEIADSMGLESVISLPFSSHDKSQRSLAKQGFKPSGISVCDWEDIFGTGQRESAIFMHKILNSEIQDLRQVKVPKNLHSVMAIAYESLECRREFSRGIGDVSLRSPVSSGMEPEIRIDASSAGAQIFLHCPTKVDLVLESICSSDMSHLKHCSVSLDISNSLSYGAIEKLLDSGFCFSGVQPLKQTDLLTLQKISDLPIDVVSGTKLYHEATSRILNQILLSQ